MNTEAPPIANAPAAGRMGSHPDTARIAHPAHPANPARLDRIDALRGFAMLWMAIYHFDYDLNHFGFIEPKQRFFTDTFWVWQRTCILSLFLFTAGLSLAVAVSRHQPTAAFMQRWLRIAGAAALVTLVTWLMFPRTYVWFGVLHGMAVMLMLARPMARPSVWIGWPLLLAAAALTAPLWAASAVGDGRWIRWLGLGTAKPITQDWVPIVPWIGVMLLGVVVGRWALRHRPVLLAGSVGEWLQPLVTMGRWSLSFYLLHQPVFYGLVWLASLAR